MKRRIAYLLATVLFTAGCSSVASHRSASQVSPTVVGASVTVPVHAATGGGARTADGAELIVPPRVLESDAMAVIQPQPDGVVEMHLSAKWNGTVQVGLPVDAASAGDDLLVHKVDGQWRVEDATLSGGDLVAHVDSLSPFTLLKCLTGGEKSIVKCLLDFGIKTIPKSIAKKIGLKVTDQCGDVLDLSSWFGSGSCRAGDPSGWQQHVTPTPQARPAPTTQQPSALQPQPTMSPEPASSSPVPAPPITQTGHVDIDPDTAAYGGVVNVWSLPARNDFCNSNFPTCDPSSVKIYQVAQGQTLTVLCYRPDGQRIITGTLADPGYNDRRWVHLASGGWLPNT